MPRQSLDAPDNLPKEAFRQVAFGELQDEVPGVPNEPAADLEESLLKTRQRASLDSRRRASRRSRLPRLYAMTPKSSRPHCHDPDWDEPGLRPGRRLILEAPVANQWGVAEPAAGPSEQIPDLSHQDVIGRRERIKDVYYWVRPRGEVRSRTRSTREPLVGAGWAFRLHQFGPLVYTRKRAEA